MATNKSLHTLFNEALDRSDAAERALFLDEACGIDTALREQVEKLLRAHVEAGGFLSRPSEKPRGGRGSERSKLCNWNNL